MCAETRSSFVKGLYPTMMILSFETACCDCCRDAPSAGVPQPIMDSINNGLRQNIRLQTLPKGETKGKILDMYKKYVQVVILADFLVALLLLSDGLSILTIFPLLLLLLLLLLTASPSGSCPSLDQSLLQRCSKSTNLLAVTYPYSHFHSPDA
jgi:hypothetical protein